MQNKKPNINVVAACLLMLLVIVCGCAQSQRRARANGKSANQAAALPSSVAETENSFRVKTVATNLQVPWSLVWTTPERLLVAERPGRVRVIENGHLRDKPLFVVPDIEPSGESGLMGMTLHPRYSENKFVYLAYAYQSDGRRVRVARYRDTGETFTDGRTIIGNIPAAKYHAGTRLRFGPDGKLYITTGDSTEGKLAQRLDSLAGKTLRVNDDGSIPNDNPFVNRASARGEIWSYGHRNSQGLDWQPDTGMLVQTEHGPTFPLDGWKSGGDEVNIVEQGKNYGWNTIRFKQTRAGMETPLLEYSSSIAPASGMFYRGIGANSFSEFRGNYFFGALKGKALFRLVFDNRNIVREERLLENKYGRIREVAEAPDGSLYFTTSNRDGRGSPTNEDDRIMRLVRK